MLETTARSLDERDKCLSLTSSVAVLLGSRL